MVISSTGKHFSAGMALETFAGAITMDDQSPEGRAAIFDVLADMQATFTKLETVHTSPHVPLYGVELHEIRIDAVPIEYDQAAWQKHFLSGWPVGSDAHTSYFGRIVNGPEFPSSEWKFARFCLFEGMGSFSLFGPGGAVIAA